MIARRKFKKTLQTSNVMVRLETTFLNDKDNLVWLISAKDLRRDKLAQVLETLNSYKLSYRPTESDLLPSSFF